MKTKLLKLASFRLDSTRMLDYTLYIGFAGLIFYAVGKCLAYYEQVMGPICY